jgi:hypothetical protein
MTESGKFDVFLSHDSRDKRSVRELAQALVNRGMRPWFDEWELIPGRSWQDALKSALTETRSVAVLIGSDGIGPWQILEQEAILREASRRGLPVIPVLLPHASESPELPVFLAGRTYVDLRQGLSKEGLARLEWGITGSRPAPVDVSSDRDQDFDVYLCFRDSDRLAVQQVAEDLKKIDIHCWPDDWTIPSEESWRRLLSHRGYKVHALAVFAADDGGPWDDDEVESFIWELIEDGQLVIPVILPNAQREPKFPVYLRRKRRIDLRGLNHASEFADLLSEHSKGERGLHND